MTIRCSDPGSAAIPGGCRQGWRRSLDLLSAEELALYKEKAAQVLTPDCKAWLEQGRVARK